jgi:predicted HicB family RNase H-like nuclease
VLRGVVIQMKNDAPLNVRVPQSLKDWLVAEALRQDVSLGKVVRRILGGGGRLEVSGHLGGES